MDWFSTWFNSDYQKLYQHRSDQTAIEEANFVLSNACPALNTKILDIACGNGRHLLALKSKNYPTIGIDLSAELLKLAQSRVNSTPLLRADMRKLPFPNSTFGLLTSFFTSFGYFSTDDEHRLLLTEWNRVLSPNGKLFIDYFNKTLLGKSLPNETQRVVENLIVTEIRNISDDGKRVEKRIEIKDPHGAIRRYHESVRMYSSEELITMLTSVGFRVTSVFGGFDSTPYSTTSPRLLIFAQT